MSYNDLSEITLTEDERIAEATRILKILDGEQAKHFTQKELNFIDKMNDSAYVTVKQLLWLRDILAKVQ